MNNVVKNKMNPLLKKIAYISISILTVFMVLLIYGRYLYLNKLTSLEDRYFIEVVNKDNAIYSDREIENYGNNEQQ